MAVGDLIHIPLWDAEPLAASGTLTSPPLSSEGMDADQLLLSVTSALGSADVKVGFVIVGPTGVAGDADAHDPLVASTATEYSATEPEETHAIVLPSVPRFQLILTELSGSNSDTLVSATATFRSRQ